MTVGLPSARVVSGPALAGDFIQAAVGILECASQLPDLGAQAFQFRHGPAGEGSYLRTLLSPLDGTALESLGGHRHAGGAQVFHGDSEVLPSFFGVRDLAPEAIRLGWEGRAFRLLAFAGSFGTALGGLRVAHLQGAIHPLELLFDAVGGFLLACGSQLHELGLELGPPFLHLLGAHPGLFGCGGGPRFSVGSFRPGILCQQRSGRDSDQGCEEECGKALAAA